MQCPPERSDELESIGSRIAQNKITLNSIQIREHLAIARKISGDSIACPDSEASCNFARPSARHNFFSFHTKEIGYDLSKELMPRTLFDSHLLSKYDFTHDLSTFYSF